RADIRKSLSHGYGVHVGFRGHDMHGPLLYVDGKIYWTIGDRGVNVQTADGRHIDEPDRGMVLRCNPDGSELEIFHTGLRNPQDLTYDQYGNFFTGDNNSDSGDKARVVHVVEGGDSGWNIGFQYMGDKFYSRGPWNAEKLWHPQFDGQAAWMLPPVGWLGNGPSGVAFYPGTGLNEDYQGHMFYCDYGGPKSQTGVYAFRFKPQGATFEMDNVHKFIWGLTCSDVEFGYDGVYVCDWAASWNPANKGRLYRVFDPETIDTFPVQSTRKLMAEGMDHRSVEELARFLAHADQRVRLYAQLALTKKEQAGVNALLGVANGRSHHQLARLHAIWGLGIVARKKPELLKSILPLLKSNDAELRAQTAKVVGDARYTEAYDHLSPLLHDESSRVRMLAAIAIGKLGNPDAIPKLLELLRDNNDADPYLRHGGVMGLVGSGDADLLARHGQDDHRSARLGILLALRRLKGDHVAAFLADSDPQIVTSAARAINDVPIASGTVQLAQLIDPFIIGDETTTADPPQGPLLRRVINANFRIGESENARKLIMFASTATNSDAMRREAIKALAAWDSSKPRDRIVNLQRPVTGTRSLEPLKRSLETHLESLL
ncbi:MAG: HEAT repeat domain-containing protein, partial [Planctomycetales bacterium]